ncbi:DUF2207 domain-containing protein [Roseibium sediminicola]|uniref:DUF2207 domain-containing protein n=1 Tax=Roseibium sediminicola TaxID=2933272 RepID=A0ABT0GN11_9HYPH|nr:DUF2207 domain-containing protein [Roseibium sp. CAU 1639]MCK7610805.1 DUF2207 domain-containing protein [Roseibium sp. CAU 1639]
MTFHRMCLAIVSVCFLLLANLTAQADERVLNYLSDIELGADGGLTVTETITVRVEWNQIERGIYRDFPLTAKAANGRLYRVGFDLLSVEMDGEPAPHFIRDNNKGIRIYVGEESRFVPKGIHTYTLKYRTDRQVRFFDTHDELYWNVTGNDWSFAIDEVTARVTLPDSVRAIEWTAYTGAFGETYQNYTAEASDDRSEVTFKTTQTLWYNEGLTIVVTMPVGSIARPDSSQAFQNFLQDYRADLIGGAGALIVFVFYLIAWLRVGRDPAKGGIFPRFTPPADISPALARYIDKRGFGDGGWIALSAACLNLAVKNRLSLREEDDDMTLSLNIRGRDGKAPGEDLPKGEAALEKWLDKRGHPLKLNKANGTSIQKLGNIFTGAITSENHNVFFRSNWLILVTGVLLSLATLVALFLLAPQAPNEQEFMILFLFLSVFATVFPSAFGLIFLPVSNYPLRIVIVLAIVGIALFGAALLAGLATGGLDTLPAVPVVVMVLVGTNLLAMSFMGAPTLLGREKLDIIEGLKLYLSVAEKDRLNMSEAPDMSTGHFEELLPYAVALGVEKPWAKAFEGWLATAAGAAAAASYNPHWYAGRDFDVRRISDSVGHTASAMAGSFQSSVPAPSSSSSGSSGGGSSGGGGGGGGGGGW